MNETINAVLKDGFERELYQAAHQNLADINNPLRLNNFACAMRELVRHLLKRLGPDNSVLACSWYKNETNKPLGISRRQRANYAVQGGLSDEYVSEVLELDTTEIKSDLVKAIDGLSKYTHIEPEIFGATPAEAEAIKNEIEDAVVNFLHTMNQCRELIGSAVSHHIDQAVLQETIRESIGTIDELATHNYIDEVYTEKVTVTSLTHEKMSIFACGFLEVELQWGSNSDIKNDLGAQASESFPFTCQLWCHIDEPEKMILIEESLRVDTSSWYDEESEEAE